MQATPPPTSLPPLPPRERPLPPPEKWGAYGPLAARRSATQAALALLVFSAVTTLALGAWFYSAANPWSWRTIVALVCDALALAASALVWRAPSRTHVVAGAAIMALSLVRVVGAWTIASAVLFAITAALLVPLVRAAIALGSDAPR